MSSRTSLRFCHAIQEWLTFSQDSPLKSRQHRGGGWCNPSRVFREKSRERIGQSSRNLVYLICEQLYIFPENFKSVHTMTLDLRLAFQGDVKRTLRSIPFQRPKLANLGIFVSDMDMNRCCEVIHGLHWHCDRCEVNRGHQRSMTLMICHFSGFCAPKGNLVRWFWIWHPFVTHMCRNRVIWVIKYPKQKCFSFWRLTPKNGS